MQSQSPSGNFVGRERFGFCPAQGQKGTVKVCQAHSRNDAFRRDMAVFLAQRGDNPFLFRIGGRHCRVAAFAGKSEPGTILLRDEDACISPFAAFLLLQGTETLSLRLERHVENAKKVVKYLTSHPQVEKVNHPSLPEHPDHALYEKYFPNGGASIFTFQIKGGREDAFRFIDNLKIFSLLANVADVKSLVIHPASTTHSQLTEEELANVGIYQNTIRLSIGTEHIDDIIADLEQAFQRVKEV